eukprot:6457547-Amphidinium_carterae.1
MRKEVSLIVWEAMQTLAAGVAMPVTWADRVTVCVPKHAGAILSPGEHRPLTMLQVAYKLVHRVLAQLLQERLVGFVSVEQHGFIPTRSISDCIVHLEASGLQVGKLSREAHIFLADFAAAFPSTARDWFEFVCARMQVPREWQNILGYFTTAWVSEFRWGGESGYGWRCAAGFPEGDPLRPWAFIVSLEPLVKCLRCEHDLHRRPHVVLKAFADDLAWTLYTLQELLKDLDIMEEWHAATALRLNHRKCVIIPCG